MRGIETAAVMYDVEESGPFGKSRSITASVCVKTSDGMPLDDQQVRTIRHTVAPAIGAKPENISVTDLDGQVYPGSAGGSLAGGSEDPYGSRKRMYEKEWRDKISAHARLHSRSAGDRQRRARSRDRTRRNAHRLRSKIGSLQHPRQREDQSDAQAPPPAAGQAWCSREASISPRSSALPALRRTTRKKRRSKRNRPSPAPCATFRSRA